MEKIELVIAPRERDLGGFSVRRILPYATHRMVGPFIFFDHMGPADFKPGDGLVVRPHPHIHLATVTYLFEGAIQHRDSLGNNQRIEPGAINWMTAGRGIVHSERAPDDLKKSGSHLSGIQLWVALPEKFQDTDPSFVHHPADSIPEFLVEGVKVRLMLGKAFGFESPVKVHSPLFYAEAHLKAGEEFEFPANYPERAFYVAKGSVDAEGKAMPAYTMGVLTSGDRIRLIAKEDSRVMFIGGDSVGERFIFWNFVSSSKAALVHAKEEWAKGPGAPGSPFPKIPGDDEEFIPLPDNEPPPRGTAL
jgi:redox-sensitive bicupin YhaK (pirin superfamily)